MNDNAYDFDLGAVAQSNATEASRGRSEQESMQGYVARRDAAIDRHMRARHLIAMESIVIALGCIADRMPR